MVWFDAIFFCDINIRPDCLIDHHIHRHLISENIVIQNLNYNSTHLYIADKMNPMMIVILTFIVLIDHSQQRPYDGYDDSGYNVDGYDRTGYSNSGYNNYGNYGDHEPSNYDVYSGSGIMRGQQNHQQQSHNGHSGGILGMLSNAMGMMGVEKESKASMAILNRERRHVRKHQQTPQPAPTFIPIWPLWPQQSQNNDWMKLFLALLLLPLRPFGYI